MGFDATTTRLIHTWLSGDARPYHTLLFRPLEREAGRYAKRATNAGLRLAGRGVEAGADELLKYARQLRFAVQFEMDVRREMRRQIAQQRVFEMHSLRCLDEERGRRDVQRFADEARQRAHEQASQERPWQRRRVKVSEHTKADGTKVHRYTQERWMKVNREGEVTLEWS